jgi:S-adenosylmethionine:tRNA ribosyltransferase-isomerase
VSGVSALMHIRELDYPLPSELIAQTPVEPRDSSRLLVCDRATQALSHRVFTDIAAFFEPGDVLVVNDTSVLNARIHGHKPSGGAVEVLLLRRHTDTTWQAMVGGRNVREIIFADGLRATVHAADDPASPIRYVVFNQPVEQLLGRLGETPLPPYIHERLSDPARYQTVYARVAGSAAAPTAGLHFTGTLLNTLRTRGVLIRFVTLHVGLDTFKPVTEERVEAHRIHSEWCELPEETAESINSARASGARVTAVGTTSMRVLESAHRFLGEGAPLRAFHGNTDLFITPGYRFQVVDRLITNFHLPKSTLLALVGAFMGMDFMKTAYTEAISQRYRFFSFGDAMFVV